MGGKTIFQSTCPARGTTSSTRFISTKIIYFNPRAPRGARHTMSDTTIKDVQFQSTCPARGTTLTGSRCTRRQTDFNPRAPRGARQRRRRTPARRQQFQSTCPARGTTSAPSRPAGAARHFNPRAPRGARPARQSQDQSLAYNFNPRAPRGARQHYMTKNIGLVEISIHVPREGHDSKHAQFFRADLRKSYKYPAERDALPTKNVCKHIKTLG